MYQTLLNEASLYRELLKLDEDLADEARKAGCRCGGKLHSARYPRKPRRIPDELEKDYSVRESFCCAEEGCRKRTTPPSFRFLGRRVYVSVVVTLVTALRHGATPQRVAKLRAEMGICRRTLERWRQWWADEFTRTSFWQSAKGWLAQPLENETLPASLLECFQKPTHQERTIDLLRFILPVTTSSGIQAI